MLLLLQLRCAGTKRSHCCFTWHRAPCYTYIIPTDISCPERAPFHSLPSQSSITLTLRYPCFRPSSELPLETRQILQVETWLRGVNPHQTPNTSHAPPRKAIHFGRRCPRLWRLMLWRPRLWQDVGTSNRFQ